MASQKVCVVGLGYVGLPVACLLAESGYKVVGVDINKLVLSEINSGEIRLEEETVSRLFQKVQNNNPILATSVPEQSDVFIICVPTPVGNGNKPNLSYIYEALESILPVIHPDNLVIIESTIPVGTTANIKQRISNYDDRLNNVSVAHCPERVLPGNSLHEITHNNRVIGGVDDKSTDMATKFYKSFCQGLIVSTDDKTAEMAKLAENTFRDVNIAFANELSMICDDLEMNVNDVIRISNMHPRVNILRPGPGVGGHCIPVDPWFIVDSSQSNSNLIRTSRKVNLQKEVWVENQINSLLERKKYDSVLIIGASYKKDIGDFRESPSIRIINNLAKRINVDIYLSDPFVDKARDIIDPSVKCSRDIFDIKNTLYVVFQNHSIYNESIAKIGKDLKDNVVTFSN